MDTTAATLTDGTEVEQDELAREFETRLVESSTLAFRVAYSVLRQREDAEDVAQEAFTRAYRRFRQLRDRWQPVVDAAPDLVLVASYTAGLAAPLIERGLPVYEFSDFSSVDSLLQNFLTLGRLVGEEERAEAIVRERRSELRTAGRKSWRRPIRAIFFSEGLLFAGGTVPSEIIELAGLDDAAADFGLVGRVTATPALMDNLRPDVVLVGEDSEAIAAQTLAGFERPEFQVVDAIRSGRVYTIPSRHATTVSHHIVSAVGDIQALPLD